LRLGQEAANALGIAPGWHVRRSGRRLH
jgi:hypothetical protein